MNPYRRLLLFPGKKVTMVSTRPLSRRPGVPHLHWPALPGSDRHGAGSQRALYVTGLAQASVAVVYAVLAITAHSDTFIPSTYHLFWVPFFVALLAIAMTTIGLMGSLSAPWLSALLNLPLALTALYIDGMLGSVLLIAALLGSAGWLGFNLLEDSARRNPTPDF